MNAKQVYWWFDNYAIPYALGRQDLQELLVVQIDPWRSVGEGGGEGKTFKR